MLNVIGEKIARFFGEGIETENISSSLRGAHEFMQANSISDILPYFTYDEPSKIFINKHSYGFVLEMSPLIGFTKQIESEIIGLLKTTMPLGSNLQFLMVASPKIGAKLDYWEVSRQNSSEILKELSNKRSNYFKEFAYSPAKMRDFKVFLSYSANLKGRLTEYNKKEIKELREAIITLFESIGLSTSVLDAQDLISMLNGLIAPKKDIYSRRRSWNKVSSISYQISDTDTSLQVTPNGLLIDEGEFLIRSYSAINYPNEWYLGAMDLLIGDNYRDLLQIECPFIISYNIHFVADRSLQAGLMAKGARVESQSNSILAKWLPSIVRQADEWRFVREQIEAGERLVRTSYQVALFSDKKNISKDSQRLLSLYCSNRWELASDKYIQLPSFISMLPMSWGDGMSMDMVNFKRSRITLSHEPVNLLPIQGDWKGTKSPGMLLTSRKGQVFYWSPFDNDSGNYNVCIAGRSGSGKSVFMQDLMTSILGLGGKVFVLDVGRSFEKTAHLLEGNFIEFSSNSNVILNPFTNIPTISENETKDSLMMLKSIIALMAAPKDGVTDIEYTFIEKAIGGAWKAKGTKATITDVVESLLSFKDTRTKDLATMLFPYTNKGVYGKFFEGEANINFDNALNVIELEELKERKDLQAVIVQIFILQITDRMFLGDRSTNYAIVFDEAWDMLRGKQSGEFIETLARRLRKYNGSLIVGTQGINDFYQSPGAQAAFDNSDWVCMLSQKAESIDQLKKSEKFNVTEHMEEMLNSVHTKQGKYAEIMITSSNGYFVGRLILEPFSRILYSTKAEEYSKVKVLQKQGLSLTESVSKVAQETYEEDR